MQRQQEKKGEGGGGKKQQLRRKRIRWCKREKQEERRLKGWLGERSPSRCMLLYKQSTQWHKTERLQGREEWREQSRRETEEGGERRFNNLRQREEGEENALNDDNKEKDAEREAETQTETQCSLRMNTYVVKVHKKRLMALIRSLSLFSCSPVPHSLTLYLSLYCLCGGFAVSSSFSCEWECAAGQ